MSNNTKNPVKRDKYGMWMHPEFKWDEIPPDTNPLPYFEQWGQEVRMVFMDDEYMLLDYFNSGYCNNWEPAMPEEEGWILAATCDGEEGRKLSYRYSANIRRILAAIYDCEEGPVSVWFRPITAISDLSCGTKTLARE